MSSIMRKFVIAVFAPALILWSTSAAAHHSAAQFDLSKRITLVGVVKEFDVRNPHTRAVITITDAKGTRDIEYEGHSASHFIRAGYKSDMVHAGDKIWILVSPRKDGNDGGFLQAFTVNGHTVSPFGQGPDTSISSN